MIETLTPHKRPQLLLRRGKDDLKMQARWTRDASQKYHNQLTDWKQVDLLKIAGEKGVPVPLLLPLFLDSLDPVAHSWHPRAAWAAGIAWLGQSSLVWRRKEATTAGKD